MSTEPKYNKSMSPLLSTMKLLTGSTSYLSPTLTAKVEPESNSVSEFTGVMSTSEPESEAEPESETEGFTEPEPDWPEAKRIWGPAWEIHIYVFGILFCLLALYSIISIIRLYKQKHLLSKKYFITLNVLMFVLAVFRGVYLLVDAYNSNRTFPLPLSYFIYTIPFPCLTSAFSILFFALLQTVQMTFISPKVQKLKYLLCIILFHFMISVVTNFVVGLLYTAEVMVVICQAIFVLWGLFLFVGFAFIFKKLYTSAKRRQKDTDKINHSYLLTTKNNVQHINEKTSTRYTLSLAVVGTFITSVFGLITIALKLYGMFGIFRIDIMTDPEPWPYWGFMTALRLTEFIMSVLMSYIATQPFRYKRRGSCDCFYLAACTGWCVKDSDSVDGDTDNTLGSVKENSRVSINNKCNLVSEETLPLYTSVRYTPNKTEPHTMENLNDSNDTSALIGENGCSRFRETLDSDSIRYIDDESRRSSHISVNLKDKRTSPLLNGKKDVQNIVGNGICFKSNNGRASSPLRVRPKRKLNRTPALDGSTSPLSWNPDVTQSGEIPTSRHSLSQSSHSIDRGACSETEEEPRVKYRLKQRHPLMQRSSSEGGPGQGHHSYLSSSESDEDMTLIDRDELARSADLSEFNQDVQDAMACLIDNSSEEYLGLEVDV